MSARSERTVEGVAGVAGVDAPAARSEVGV